MANKNIINNKLLNDLEIIDAHGHIGTLTEFYSPRVGLDELIRLMDKLGINKICVSHLDCLHSYIQGGNRKLLNAVERYPGRIYGYCTINPWNPEEAKGELEKYLGKKGFIGIKIHPDYHRYPVDGENYKLVWEYAQKYNAVVLAHTWSGSSFSAPKRFEGILENHSNIKLLLGHSGGLFDGYMQSYKLVGKYQNVYMELCGCEFSNTWLEDVLDNVDYKNVIFGTDQIFHDPRFLLGRVVLSDISETAKAAILGENMKRITQSIHA